MERLLRLRKVAITGCLSCGKTEVCRFLKGLGAYVLSTDEIVHQILSFDAVIAKKVVDLLGNDVIINGKISHSRVARKVFNSSKNLRNLEKILHPVVQEKIENEYQIISKEKGILLFVVEIPLLFEIGAEKYFDQTVAVIANDEICQQRFKKKTQLDINEYKKRMARQLPSEIKAQKANFVIANNKSLNELKIQVKTIKDKLCKE